MEIFQVREIHTHSVTFYQIYLFLHRKGSGEVKFYSSTQLEEQNNDIDISNEFGNNIDTETNSVNQSRKSLTVKLTRNEDEKKKVHSNPDVNRLSPFKDKYSSGSSNLSPLSISSEISLFSFSSSDISGPSSPGGSGSALSPKPHWRGVRGARPISPLVTGGSGYSARGEKKNSDPYSLIKNNSFRKTGMEID